ncbi:MAG: hypothetical protein OWU33_11500 [Firmicutes bacterium]|nr:hypothetical protein [Bacillota bacterium]
MLHSRHAVIASGAAVAMLGLLGLALWVFKPLSSVSTARPVAWTPTPVLSAPLIGPQGQRLTRSVDLRGWWLVPSEMSPVLRRHFGLRRGSPAELWWRSVKGPVTKAPGVIPTSLQLIEPLPSFRVIMTLANLVPGALKEEKLVEDGRRFVLATRETPPLRVTLDPGLERSLASITHAGAIVVISRTGRVLAATGSRSWLAGARPLGLVELPPLLSWALAQPGGSSVAIGGKGPTLNKFASWWTPAKVSRALAELGVAPQSLGSTPSTLSQAIGGTGLATPLAVVRSYLPFVDAHQVPSLSLTPSSPLKARPVPGDFATVLEALPMRQVNGIRFRLWDPRGSWTVILAPTQGRVAVLVGGATDQATAVMQCLSRPLLGGEH